MKIFVNAGHGGSDSGAVSKHGFKESEINRTIAGYLVQMLIVAGYDVEFFQQTNSVEQVVEAEKKSNSHLFVSIHCNSFTKEAANGVEVLYYPTSGTGKALAEIISENLAQYMTLKNRGAKARNDLRVLSGTKAPAILIESAFLSNLKEEEMLLKDPYSFASGILKGLREWDK